MAIIADQDYLYNGKVYPAGTPLSTEMAAIFGLSEEVQVPPEPETEPETEPVPPKTTTRK